MDMVMCFTLRRRSSITGGDNNGEAESLTFSSFLFSRIGIQSLKVRVLCKNKQHKTRQTLILFASWVELRFL
jgi:hypothetical protein